MAESPLKTDAPFYTDDELDALYERDPVLAMRISREQEQLRRAIGEGPAADADAALPDDDALRAVLEEARRILLRDGGDLEFVAREGAIVKVRLKGACVGCPRSALDLRNVVEALVRRRYPAIAEVRNTF